MNKYKVLLDRANKWFFCDGKKLALKTGDRVVVESLRGQELGSVVEVCKDDEMPKEETLLILRKQTSQDEQKAKELEKQEQTILTETKAVVKDLGLDMKLSAVQLNQKW